MQNIIRDAFIAWIVFQLIVVGISATAVDYKMTNKTYECVEEISSSQLVYQMYGAIIPLVMFIPTPSGWDKYCEEQLKENNYD